MNVTISALKAQYQSGILTPRQLILDLRDRALAGDDNAWITLLTKEQLDVYISALEQNETADQLPLYGIPFAIKDNIDLAGVPTTAGCAEFSYTPTQNAFVVERLIAAGAIPLGKTNMDQFATGLVGTRSPYGEGKNVFNGDYISGGSSSGSAIATARGLVSFALGTDTAGSGRVPAALNNLIGHKPTKGLLSCQGVVPACKSLDCISIFALTAEDAAIVLNVAAEFDEADFLSRENTVENQLRYFSGAAPSSFTFGVPDQLDFFGNTECEALFGKAIEALQALGGIPKTIEIAPFLDAAKLLYEGPWVAERWLATQGVDQKAMLPVIQSIIGKGNKASAADLFSAQYKLAALKMQCDAIVNSADVMLAPTMPTVFTRAQIAEEPIKNNSILGTYTNFMNLLDYTATAVPVGALDCAVHWGITLFSKPFCDVQLLNMSQALQREFQLPLGALDITSVFETRAAQPPTGDMMDILVCGAHLQGQPLNWQLTERGAHLKSTYTTSDQYRLFALTDGKRPALVRDGTNGQKIDVEVWQVPAATVGSFLNGIAAPLGLGKVELASGEWVTGFICDGYGLEGAKDITEYGSWREWLSSAGR